MKGGFYSRGEIEGIVQKIRNPHLAFGKGKVFYVDGAVGSNGNDGDDPEKPLLTIQYALSLCVNYRDDYIIVLNTNGGASESFPITVTKSRVHIIGLDVGNGKYPRLSADVYGDTAAFLLCEAAGDAAGGEGGYFEIAGFRLSGGATHGAIEFPVCTTPGATLKARGVIRNNWIGRVHAARDGIYMPALTDVPELVIEDNIFGLGITRDGIRVDYNATRTIIRRNLFRVGAIGINVPGHIAAGWILDNLFVMSGVVAGRAITLTNTDGIFVNGNHAQTGKTAMGVIPYVDGGANDWGTNYQDIVEVLPA